MRGEESPYREPCCPNRADTHDGARTERMFHEWVTRVNLSLVRRGRTAAASSSMFPGIRHHGRTQHDAHQRRCTTADATPRRVYSPADRVDDVDARSVHPSPGTILQARPRSQQPYPSHKSDGRRRCHRLSVIRAVLPTDSQPSQRRPQVAVRNNLVRQAAPHPICSDRGGDRSHVRRRAHSNWAPCLRACACGQSRLG